MAFDTNGMFRDNNLIGNYPKMLWAIADYIESNAVAAELGIKVIGQEADVSDIPEGEYNYGDAYMIGTEVPYTMYIWTRANGNHPEDYWFEVGQFPMPGPQGEPGLGVDDMLRETLTQWSEIDATYDSDTDITDMIFNGTKTQYFDDNTSRTVTEQIMIPIKTDGQIVPAPYQDANNNYAMALRLSKNLDNTYVSQQTLSGGGYAQWTNVIYGGPGNSTTTKINSLKAYPLGFYKNNVIMNPATGDAADANSCNDWNLCRWNTMLGKGNQLQGANLGNQATANTENLVFGGKNILHDGVQDSATFGYRNEIYANQAMTHGYKNTNKGGESFVQGTENQLLGNITIDTDSTDGYDGASSDTKASAVIGNKNVIQHGMKHSLVVGNQQTVDTNCQQIIVIGNKNKIGKSCSWTNTFGDSNEVKNYATDSTVFGYDNKIWGGSSGTPVQYVYEFGRHNDNAGNGSNHSYAYMFGDYLNTTKDHQVVVGSCNKGDATEANAFFVVGTGTLGGDPFGTSNTPKTTLMVKDGETDFTGIIKIGNTSLSEAQLQSLLALIS